MTLLDRARSGITDEIRFVSDSEGIDAEVIRNLLCKGEIVILQNNSKRADPVGVGSMLSTKVNANVGTSTTSSSLEEEVEKARAGVESGADTVMDLSTGGNLDLIRQSILGAVNAPVGTVPLYQAACKHTSIADISSDEMFNVLRQHCRDGVDFVTVHAGVNRNSLRELESSNRILGVVSRGGAITTAWMLQHDSENPFYSEFDYLLEILSEYDVVASLGDGMRPGCIHDSSDRPEYTELITLGELVERCRRAGVQCMVEGPGHVPLDEIETSVRAMKYLSKGAPVYLLGPLVTDLAPGYDHFTAAIGGAIAGMHGADFLCVTTPAEHLALPTSEDIRNGVMVTRIAAHAIDLVKDGQRKSARRMDNEIARARRDLNWQRQLELAIDPEHARRTHSRSKETDVCSMCGELCAIKVMNDTTKK
ncbi:phosphomethylpyrimidine synthase [Methanosarcinales archaeon ex4572_44]|nr:MAG: phosphomethylpyrimidine synthase [Methanosarcinales archaeon ex4484_138]PHP45662.1 MAG: phosphomethylpyrimidine synthase [Methanosarcinales archaeon ex4572_44]